MKELFGRFEIDRWLYEAYRENGVFQFNITPDIENYESPQLLAKLYSLNAYSLDAIKGNYIYAPHPCQFNDLYDCHEDLIRSDDPQFTDRFIRPVFGDQTDEILQGLQDPHIYAQRNFREIYFRKVAPISLTNNLDNPLMWAYYNNNQGFGIELKLSEITSNYHGPFPINYQEEINPISLKDYDWPVSVLYQSNIKSKLWKHESEYRLLLQAEADMASPACSGYHSLPGAERKLFYKKDAITHVFLGNRFFKPTELEILEDATLQVELINSAADLRIQLLDLIIEREYLIAIARMQDNLMSLGFWAATASKTEETEKRVIFRFIQINGHEE